METCVHIIRLSSHCGHTWDDVKHAADCTISSTPAVLYTLLDIDVHISRLYSAPSPGDPRCEILFVDRAVLEGCCQFCHVKNGKLLTRHPVGHISNRVLVARREEWEKLCYEGLSGLQQVEKYRRRVRETQEVIDRHSVFLLEYQKRVEQHQTAHEERRQNRKNAWFAGLARYHEYFAKKGVHISKRRYIFSRMENLSSIGNILQEVDPASFSRDEEADYCVFCCSPLNDVQQRVAKLPCGHIYHLGNDCILRWLETGHRGCPTCRTKFNILLLPDFNDPEYSECTRLSVRKLVVRGYDESVDDWPFESMTTRKGLRNWLDEAATFVSEFAPF